MRDPSAAQRCDGCMRVTYRVQRCALLIDGQMRAERSLCPACRTNALDGFLAASDGVKIPRVSRR